MQKKDIVIYSFSRLDNDYSSTMNSLAPELGKLQRVFVIEYPFTLVDVIKKFKTPRIKKRLIPLLTGRRFCKKESDQLYITTPMVLIPANWVSKGFLYKMIARYNEFIVRRALHKTIKKHSVSNFVFINAFNSVYLKRVNPKKYSVNLNMYYVVDNLRPDGYLGKHGIESEKQIIKVTDAILATSTELQKIKGVEGKNSYFLPNACDLTLFSKAYNEDLKKPEYLIPFEGKKIICYVGNIEWKRFDFELLEKVARQYSDAIVLMVGPVNVKINEYIQGGVPENIKFIGSKPLKEIPGILKYVDCTIIPFKLNELTRSIYPLKINEYLATGKPVVTTGFSEDIKTFSDVANVSEDHDAFVQAIQSEMENDTQDKQQKRVERAKENTWEKRAIRLNEIIEEEMNFQNRN